MTKKPYLVTMQEPGKPRYRHIVYDTSSFEALNELMDIHVSADTYIAVRPATKEDLDLYGDM